MDLRKTRFVRVRQVFERAVELAPQARSAYLDQECLGDPSLRSEVCLLLKNTFSENAPTDRIGGVIESASRSLDSSCDITKGHNDV